VQAIDVLIDVKRFWIPKIAAAIALSQHRDNSNKKLLSHHSIALSQDKITMQDWMCLMVRNVLVVGLWAKSILFCRFDF